MRADRLVAALLVLQARGRVTTAELAEELEISPRTARRDLEALSMAGIPVYPQRGRGGGWQLLGDARTDLTGLTASEAQALFLTVGTSAIASPALRSAAKKLVQALPESFRGDAARASDAVMIDPARWGRTPRIDQLDHLEPLQAALLGKRQVELSYAGANAAPSVRIVHPLGLVTKAGVWYLVAMTAKGQRTFRVSRVTKTLVLDTPSETPDDFDLRDAWASITATFDQGRRPVTATGIADPWALEPLRFLFGSSLTVGAPRRDGRYDVSVSAQSEQAMAGMLAGLGSAFELIQPRSIGDRLARIGAELVNAHASDLASRPQDR